ncbi:hypothetical protein [Zhongshania marina]|uniref:Uncharacterized protein n=1 Tax=Zhongshania marina TaxID=2304603 RepID=A0A2S4HC23_9GAMM|nr:hypothetical protein [Marortus luteolus]POP51507.1 hypothetical protein C0068_16335 [Marortus luteolus]
MLTETVTKPATPKGTQCVCDKCTETAIDLATKVARRTGRDMSVVATRHAGICIYDDGTALANKTQITHVIFQTHPKSAVA